MITLVYPSHRTPEGVLIGDVRYWPDGSIRSWRVAVGVGAGTATTHAKGAYAERLTALRPGEARDLWLGLVAELWLETALEGHCDPCSEESFVQCHVCGGWDGHDEDCPVPGLETWLKEERS